MHLKKLCFAIACSMLLTGCTTDAYKSGYDTGYQDADMDHEHDYSDGFNDGYSAGQSVGYESGYDDGFDDGYIDGYGEIEDELYFWRNSAVIVSTTGEKYHTYGCYHIDGRRYWIYNIELAQAKGYAACLDCIDW